MTQTHTSTGVTVILEGKSRQKWRRTSPSQWQLDGVWPSRREKEQALRALRAGRPILVIQDSAGESVDLLDEEASDLRQLAGYVTACENGVTSLFIPALDWLPPRITRTATSFIAENTRLGAMTDSNDNTVLTPPLGRRKNLRVLHLPTIDTTARATERLNALADLAFPQTPNRRKATR